jgi:hypothetical protein
MESNSRIVRPGTNSIDNFIDRFPFAFSDQTKEKTHSRLQKYAQRSRARFDDLLIHLKIKKE